MSEYPAPYHCKELKRYIRIEQCLSCWLKKSEHKRNLYFNQRAECVKENRTNLNGKESK